MVVTSYLLTTTLVANIMKEVLTFLTK